MATTRQNLAKLPKDQREEIEIAITELAKAAKFYGMGLGNPNVSTDDVEDRFKAANDAWCRLMDLGLIVQF